METNFGPARKLLRGSTRPSRPRPRRCAATWSSSPADYLADNVLRQDYYLLTRAVKV